MNAVVLRGDARHLPLPDGSVDLIVTSPPFWQLRSYTDEGYCRECQIIRENGRDPKQAWPDYPAHWQEVHAPRPYDGQIGSEPTFTEYLDSLLECTREWVRVLKPTGSLFVELGDKYSDRGHGPSRGNGTGRGPQGTRLQQTRGPMEKSLLDLPARYSIRCVDELGLIKRANIVWHHTNGLPESVTDRVRASHSVVFHLVKQPRYYAAIDEIREAHELDSARRSLRYGGRLSARSYATGDRNDADRQTPMGLGGDKLNPLGKLPGSVWNIPSQPLTVPAWLGVSHFAAFPAELPRRVILGWSPPGICTACGEGLRPVANAVALDLSRPQARKADQLAKRAGLTEAHFQALLSVGVSDTGRGAATQNGTGKNTPEVYALADEARAALGGYSREYLLRRPTGFSYACACTPYTDHPERRGKDFHNQATRAAQGANDHNGGERYRRYVEEMANPRGPVREYDQDWTPPPTRPAVVVDPFGGTGCTALVADMYGRTGLSFDLSADYCRLARWRTRDPAERAKALQVAKPPPVPDGQGSLFGEAL